ncbi:RNA polymerase sigma-70 factor [Marinobacterium lacunae]|uniref:RNA polymerase sigma-70 factor n=1 Tax=Marinobacterium lacunae TaxID=1232683 RepID=A0A081FZQ6_9GAMM|nr:sigma-70 family RNA polymerase sigma factor [Marinobacterium lacunae]KEA64011.1 RNA polymerase sigma-70 factor [Marinobacterium lacunae]MBR9884547.1 sigma-70 family RNA polymerase sigma factor [Oceanospirillales bacterium]
MRESETEEDKLIAAAETKVDRDLSDCESWSRCLTRMAQTRDKQLFAQLFSHFGPRLKGYVLRLGVPAAVAEELAQEAMLNVWRKAHLFNADKANASTWIFTLARNLCIDRLRRERVFEYELPAEEADPDERHYGEHAVLEHRMQQAISELPEAQAQVLFLSYYEGKSHSEIAEQLGIPMGSVKSRLRLAFNKLRLLWGEES